MHWQIVVVKLLGLCTKSSRRRCGVVPPMVRGALQKEPCQELDRLKDERKHKQTSVGVRALQARARTLAPLALERNEVDGLVDLALGVPGVQEDFATDTGGHTEGGLPQ